MNSLKWILLGTISIAMSSSFAADLLGIKEININGVSPTEFANKLKSQDALVEKLVQLISDKKYCSENRATASKIIMMLGEMRAIESAPALIKIIDFPFTDDKEELTFPQKDALIRMGFEILPLMLSEIVTGNPTKPQILGMATVCFHLSSSHKLGNGSSNSAKLKFTLDLVELHMKFMDPETVKSIRKSGFIDLLLEQQRVSELSTNVK